MDNATYILLGLIVAAALLLFFLRKKAETPAAPPELKEPGAPSTVTPSPKPAEPARKPAAEPEPKATPQQPTPGEQPPASAPERKVPPSAPAARVHPAPTPERATGEQGPGAEQDVQQLRKGLARSRGSEGFFGRLRSLLSGRAELSPELAEQIEEVLLSSDVGVATTSVILERIRTGLDRGSLADEAAVWAALRQEVLAILKSGEGKVGRLNLASKPTVVLMVGVNGAGKTTTIGKLATQLKSQGKLCVLAAGDTFRAAAVQQLSVWGQRVGCEVVKGKDGSDPGSVVFEAIKKAQQIGADVVLADTAGRLHTKSNLMAEMQKIARTAGKALDGAPHDVLLVIDATNGQNALAQAREFKESLELSGIVLTKLDGTAKGGVILGIAHSLKLPVRYVGLGERPDDLHEFVPEHFVEALLGKDS